MKIAYFAHDLLDPAIERRIRMFRQGGASVSLTGFRRSESPPRAVVDVVAHDLGLTRDGQLARRAASVALTMLRPGAFPDSLAGADVFVARNLEMLAIAARARALFAPHAKIVYELLDIHRVMLDRAFVGRFVRRMERYLLGKTDLIIVSSAAFEREYLRVHQPGHPKVLLVENKVVLQSDTDLPGGIVARDLPYGPPWRIGWFGIIRCKKSLELLSRTARQFPGLLEVDIRGRPAATDLGDFDSIVGNTPGIRFLGPYKNPDDLAHIYGSVHFSWVIDFYESGQNARWLLPNRLYEGPLFGAIPISVASSETGRWVGERQAGLVLDEPLEETLPRALQSLTQDQYQEHVNALDRIGRRSFMYSQSDARDLVKTLGAL